MSRVSLLAFFAMSLTLALLAPAAAQDYELLAELYGEGVHAYYAGDNQAAYDALTEAIEGGTDDPRAFYFRGLVLERMGREEAAVADFEAGAIAEVHDTDNYYNVNVSLERVQGYTRLAIEEYRQAARLTESEKMQAERAARYQRTQGAEERVIRGEPSRATRDAEEVRPRYESDDDADDLFGDAPDTGTLPAGNVDDDMFGGETGSGVDAEPLPFGDEDTAQPLEDEDFMQDSADDDLFPGGDDADAGDDLFPSGDEDDAADDDIFGDDTTEDAAGDIFGDDATEDAADDDIFGEPSDDDDMLPGGDAAGDAAGEEDGPGGRFGLGDAVEGIFGGGGGADFEAGPPGMDDTELPYEDGAEDLDAAHDDHEAGPPGMDDTEFPYEDGAEDLGDASDDAEIDPFADDAADDFVPRPEMQDEFLEEGDPVRPSDGIPEMQDSFLEEGGAMEEEGVPAPDAVEDGPGAEEDFDEVLGS